MTLDAKLDQVVRRHEEVGALLAEPGLDSTKMMKLSKEHADLTPVVEAINGLRQAERDLEQAEAMLADPEMKELAEAEYHELKEKLPALERAVQVMLLPKDAADERNAILEVRSGTGGDEAALFAGELLRMYERYAQTQGWRFSVMDISEGEVGGVKEAIAEISGKGVFAKLKFESGVHRVQRVPVTESGGRIHTSAATVAVLPEAEEVDIHIDPSDLRIDTYRSQGAGGQHVNTTDSAVRITHLPTGIVAACQEEKSQHKNKDKAMKMLMARMYEVEREKAATERSDARRIQVGSGDRSEKIRTYNFPQGRVTDHRIKLTLHKLEQVMNGEALDEMVEALIAEDQAARLAELGNS